MEIKFQLPPNLAKNVREGYVAAQDVMKHLKETNLLEFPEEKETKNTALRDLKHEGKPLVGATFDKVDGLLYLNF